MSLAEKLAQQTQALEEQKKAAEQEAARAAQETEEQKKAAEQEAAHIAKEQEQAAKDAEYAPVFARIAEIQQQEQALAMIKNSLGGIGEYATQSDTEFGTEGKKIDELVDANKEVLKGSGVENREQLVSHADFAEEQEVVQYKAAEEKVGGVKLSDEALKQRLADLGIAVDSDNFLYGDIEKLIDQKVQSLEKELMQEKIKTPEGKAEAIEALSEKIKGDLPGVTLQKNKSERFLSIGLPGKNRVLLGDDKYKLDVEKFDAGGLGELLPKNIESLEKDYSPELAKEVVFEAHSKNIKNSFDTFNGTHNIRFLQKTLENGSPEEAQKAASVIKEFSAAHQSFLKALDEKALALKEKGVDIEPRSSKGWFETGFFGSVDAWRSLGKSFDHDTKSFPPEVDWVMVQELGKARMDDLQDMSEFLASLDVLPGEDSRMFNQRFNSTMNDLYKGEYADSKKVKIDSVVNLSNAFSDNEIYGSYSQNREKVLNAVNAKVARQDVQEKLVTEKVKKLIELEYKHREFDTLAKSPENKDLGVQQTSDVEKMVRKFSDEKMLLRDLSQELAKIEASISGPIRLEQGRFIKDVSKEKEGQSLSKKISELELALQVVHQDIKEKTNNKPRLLGVSKWQQELDVLNGKEKVLRDDIGTQRALCDKAYGEVDVPLKMDSGVESQLLRINRNDRNAPDIEGLPEEVFAAWKQKIAELSARAVPPELVVAAREYEESARIAQG